MPRSLVVPVIGFAALAAVIAWAGGRDAPPATLFERVTSAPERYRDRVVHVTGQVQERSDRVPAAFTLRGPNGRRLLVMPGPDAASTAVTIGMRVAVRGRVVPIDAPAEDRPHVAADSDIATRLGAVAIVRAAALSARGQR